MNDRGDIGLPVAIGAAWLNEKLIAQVGGS